MEPMKYVTSVLQAANPMLLYDINGFDQNAFQLNTPTATYDFRYGMNGVGQHSLEDRITKVTTVSPGTDGAEIWQEALNIFFCGDDSLIDYVQKIAGMAAIGKVCNEALIIAYGSGSNGKSTFWNTISCVPGSYSGTISADALTAGCRRNIKPEIAELKVRRLVIASELEERMRLATS